MTRLRADLLLLLVAFIWGTAFIAQKNGNGYISPILFVGLRFFLSSLVLAPLAFFEKKRSNEPLNKKDVWLTVLIGLILFCATSLQQIGLLTTTATNAGFLTALYVVLVPFVGWLLSRHKPRSIVIAAGLISIIGAWLLAGQGQMGKWATGDILMLVADILWALHISLITVFMQRVNRALFLSVVQYSVTAVCGLSIGLFFGPVAMGAIISALPAILYAGVLSGGVAYTLQVVAQRHTPAAEAALIVSLESVFAAIAGAILLQERLTLMALVGCALILLSVVMVEVGPIFRRTSAEIN